MAIYYAAGGNSNQGRVVKVHRNTQTSTWSSTSTNNNIFNDTISPTTSGSWFIINWRACVSHTTNNSMYMQILVAGSVVGGRGGGSHQSAGLSMYNESYGNSHLFNAGYWQYNGQYIYTPSNSNSWSFVLRTRSQGGTHYLNYAYSYNDNQRGYPRSEYYILECEGS